jgi:hypothetical protein
MVINGSGTITGLVAGGLPDATITSAELASGAARTNFGAGAVLQVVTQTFATAQSTTSGSAVASGLSLSITPSSTTSKILIFASFGDTASNASANGMKLWVFKNGSILTQFGNNDMYATAGGVGYVITATPFVYSDSPSTTSAVTYDMRFASQNGSSSVILFRDNTAGGLTLMEIAA